MDSNQAPPNKLDDDDRLGVNRSSKSIKKSPNSPNPNTNEPQVYNVKEEDFRDIVLQMTGPNHPGPSPPTSPKPKPPNDRWRHIPPPPPVPNRVPAAPQPRPANPNNTDSIVDSGPQHGEPQNAPQSRVNGPPLNIPPPPPRGAVPPPPPENLAPPAEADVPPEPLSPTYEYLLSLPTDFLNPPYSWSRSFLVEFDWANGE